MDTMIKKLAITGLVGLLAACNDSSSSSSSPAPTPDPEPSVPTITQLSKSGDMLVGRTIKAESECTDCEPDKTTYTWVVDRTGTGVFGDSITVDGVEIRDHVVEGQTFLVTEDDYGKAVRLSAIANNDGLSSSDEAFVVYRRRFVEDIVSNLSGYSALTNDGTVIAWGKDIGPDPIQAEDVREIIPNNNAFAAIRNDGSVVAWGNRDHGSDASQPSGGDLDSGVVQVFATDAAFAALKDDGSVVAWGYAYNGGDITLSHEGDLSSGVDDIVPGARAFAALKNDGSLVAWGNKLYGGDVSEGSGGDFTGGFKKVIHNTQSFAAIKESGEVITWGWGDGGTLSEPLKNVDDIIPNLSAYAALKEDGSVVAWGHPDNGGHMDNFTQVGLSSGVKRVVANAAAFAALKEDGSVVAWGKPTSGGDITVGGGDDLSSNIVDIIPNLVTFAALKLTERGDHEVVAWGDSMFGGDTNWSLGIYKHNVSEIIPGTAAFVGISSIDNFNANFVFAWGHPEFGGIISPGKISNVEKIVTNKSRRNTFDGGAFAAITRGGGVRVWGEPRSGGYLTPEKQSELNTRVKDVFSTTASFAALKENGEVITWGEGTGANNSNAAEALAPQDILLESSL
ncbi:hypothetical protein GZ77_25475 [Endozoicomonas montiporae]|uniref:Uncharacterized protein n=2 Tax=Endozoicomonas montiporae TaxID=1027273 RepID=A0A081MZ30_9GAMM|nr:hypothetical protein [Endozoicomonas montiporae]AMO54927.1 putative lipoprotein [Endozoicomonas montiporae CL-33]KEQ11453.1 hypothetical protein GZ77_25475 [Endozoicomonas montiporae]